MTTGIWREVRLTAEATDGDSATNRSVTLRRSSGAATGARTDHVSAPISTVVVGGPPGCSTSPDVVVRLDSTQGLRRRCR
jgi:hypothetical protein